MRRGKTETTREKGTMNPESGAKTKRAFKRNNKL